MTTTSTFRTVLISTVSALAMLTGAQAAEVLFNIPAQPLSEALMAFSRQSDVTVTAPFALVKDKQAPAVQGEMPASEALDKLLEGSGLKAQPNRSGVLTIRQIAQNATERANTGGAVAANPTQTAQVSDSAASRNDVSRIEEVIVTAQKREERLQDVPLSITAITATDIERRGLVGQADYLRSLPGVSQIEAGAGNSSIIMRGISASPQNLDRGSKATVGYYLNDIPLTGYSQRGSADLKLVDLERVEVIRGPQGTLYGSGSLGGTVRNIAAAPKVDRIEGRISAGYSNTAKAGSDNGSAEGVINIPLVENKVAARIVGYWFDNSGYIDNIAGSDATTLARAAAYGVPELAVNDTGIGREKYVGGRAAVLFQPTDELNATLTYLTQDITQDGLPDAEFRLGGNGYRQARMQLGSVVGGGSERLEDNLDIYNATVEYGFDWGALTSSSSVVNQDYLEKREIGVFFPGAPPFPQRNPGDTEAFTQEIRFASQFDGPAQVLAGFYYENAQRDFLSANFFGGRTNNPFSRVVYTDDLTENNIKQKSFFGELSYEWNGLELTVGGRAFSYDDVTTITRGPSHTVPAGNMSRLKGENDGTTFKANLSYKPNDDTMFYAQWSEGFRLGSPVGAANAACDTNNDGLVDGTGIPSAARTLDPDSLDSYEVGTKFGLMDGAVVVNAAAYRNTWTGVPVRVVVACGFSIDANAGEAKTKGVEFSSQYFVTPDLQLSLAASYGKAELAQDSTSLGGVKGDRLPGSPKYTVNLGAEYEFDVADRESYVRVDYAYVGAFYNNLKQTGITNGDYGLLNLRAGVEFDAVAVDVFVKNATNNDAVTWADATFQGANARVYRMRPRTVGIEANYRF